MKRAANRPTPQYPLRVSIKRLRGRHGVSLFGGILRKIDRSDILFFDISGKNPNVHFELGYAICQKGEGSGRVYVFNEKKENNRPCSDLSGYMLTEYSVSRKGDKSKFLSDCVKFKLLDQRGFRSSLINSIIDVAIEREMWSCDKCDEFD